MGRSSSWSGPFFLATAVHSFSLSWRRLDILVFASTVGLSILSGAGQSGDAIWGSAAWPDVCPLWKGWAAAEVRGKDMGWSSGWEAVSLRARSGLGRPVVMISGGVVWRCVVLRRGSFPHNPKPNRACLGHDRSLAWRGGRPRGSNDGRALGMQL